MDNQIDRYKKYIDRIILKKYSGIESYEIKPLRYFKNHLNITFFVDGTEEGFENNIQNDISDMKSVFGDSIPLGVTFQVV